MFVRAGDLCGGLGEGRLQCWCRIMTLPRQCNCDAAAAAWTEDSGHLTSRHQLPVTKLNFGALDGEGQDARCSGMSSANQC